MPYYPLSQILPNLYTNGEEYVLQSTRKSYKGYYFETSDGSKYSGKVPSKSSELLLEVNPATSVIVGDDSSLPPGESIRILNDRFSITDDIPIINPQTNDLYPYPDSKYISNDRPRSVPSRDITLPTPEDKKVGIYNRYFCKKNNELRYFEINQSTYTLLSSLDPLIAFDLYTGAFLDWKIKGEQEKVFVYNRNQAKNVERIYKWPGFSQYFKNNFTQFYLED